jgi:predicted nuclease of predicted toxin-antitoxin system
MRVLANENIPRTLLRELRDRGHDVLSAKESMRGEDDPAILARAQTEARLVVTQDKDFGELAFRFGLPASSGVILFRLSGSDPEADTRRMMEVIESRADWSGQFKPACVCDSYRRRVGDRRRVRPPASSTAVVSAP